MKTYKSHNQFIDISDSNAVVMTGAFTSSDLKLIAEIIYNGDDLSNYKQSK